MKKFTYFARPCLFIAFIAFLFTGCARLLPSSRTDVKSPWKTYDEAKIAYGKITPYETTAEDLKKMGIDPYSTPNIKILTATDIMSIFMPNPSIKKEDLEPGIQKCIALQEKCRGYLVEPKILDKDRRQGNFWMDFLSFEQITKESGWEFAGLVILIDNIVIYKRPAGGIPFINRQETVKKPLGPFQNSDQLIDTGKKILLP